MGCVLVMRLSRRSSLLYSIFSESVLLSSLLRVSELPRGAPDLGGRCLWEARKVRRRSEASEHRGGPDPDIPPSCLRSGGRGTP